MVLSVVSLFAQAPEKFSFQAVVRNESNQLVNNSQVGVRVSILQGSTDTTFYILAIYFGSVGIKKYRYSVACGLMADFAGFIAAVFISYFFFG